MIIIYGVKRVIETFKSCNMQGC